MATTDSSFPVVLSRDLPPYTGTLGDGDSILVIIKNTTLYRASASKLTENNVFWEHNAPSTSSSSGRPGSIAWDTTGIYTYVDGAWGKTPRYLGHWEDLTETSRFLRVDADQSLSSSEKQHGIKNLGIDTSTETNAGVVKKVDIITPTLDQSDVVPSVKAMIQYVAEHASVVYNATTSTAGIVMLSNTVDQSINKVPTCKAVYDFFNKEGGGIGTKATFSSYGIVKLAATISENDVNVPTSDTVYTYISTQSSAANTSRYGTVKMASSISPDDSGVPTAAMVANYMASRGSDAATTTKAGAVRLAESISSGETGVTTGNLVYNYIQDKLKDASTTQKGLIQLASSIDDDDSSKAVTAAQVKNYVNSLLGGGGGTGSGSGSGSGTGVGGDRIASYRGHVSIKGPNDEQILVYDATTHTLTVGAGIKIKSVNTQKPEVVVNNISSVS